MKNKVLVLDTNIWISFIIGRKLHQLAEIITSNNLVILNCEILENEIYNVLIRPKFKRYIKDKDIVEAIILIQKLSTAIQLGDIKRYTSDLNDDFLFALCYKGNADYIVSGDKHILKSGITPPPVILTLNEFIKMF